MSEVSGGERLHPTQDLHTPSPHQMKHIPIISRGEIAVREGLRILSAYELEGTRFWSITEADRSVTMILLPDEY